MTVYTMNCTPILFNSCPERLCEGLGQTLRKDDSCESSLVLYMNYIYLYGFLPGLQLWRGRDDIGDMFKYGKQVINTHAYTVNNTYTIYVYGSRGTISIDIHIVAGNCVLSEKAIKRQTAKHYFGIGHRHIPCLGHRISNYCSEKAKTQSSVFIQPH